MDTSHALDVECEVELPILPTLQQRGVEALDCLRGRDVFSLAGPGPGLQQRGNLVMNNLGVAFRAWCREKKVERPPSSWDMKLLGRGDSDKATQYPSLDTEVKAAHCKPFLFYLAEVAAEIFVHCKCNLSCIYALHA